MITTLEVKNGIIRLPADIQKKIAVSKASVTDNGLVINIEIKQKIDPQKQYEAWKKLEGMLKGRVTEDPVEWQKKIREEWERPLP